MITESRETIEIFILLDSKVLTETIHSYTFIGFSVLNALNGRFGKRKDNFMSNFKYVPKKEYLPVKKELINLINLVQNEVREYFTFSFEFIGSASRNMITRDESSNVGYDFDVNIMVNDNDNVYSAKKLNKYCEQALISIQRNLTTTIAKIVKESLQSK